MIGAGHVSRKPCLVGEDRVMSAVLGTLGHYLGRIFLTTVAALLIYFALKFIRKIFNVRWLALRGTIMSYFSLHHATAGLPGGVRNVDSHVRTSLVSPVTVYTIQ